MSNLDLPVTLKSHLRRYLGRDIDLALTNDWPMFWTARRTPFSFDLELRAVTAIRKDGSKRTRSIRSCYDPANAILIHMAIVTCSGQVDQKSLADAVAVVDAARTNRVTIGLITDDDTLHPSPATLP